MEKLVISEERLSGINPVSVITLRGTVETTNAAGLEDTLQRVIDDRCYRIVVDLGDVSYVSSAGWGIFISEIKRIRRNGGDIKLAAMRPEVREVFELLEFNSILRPFDDRGLAVKDFDTVDAGSAGEESASKG
jgi:anti-anti-sigma factor